MDPLTPLDTLCRIILRAREYEAQTATDYDGNETADNVDDEEEGTLSVLDDDHQRQRRGGASRGVRGPRRGPAGRSDRLLPGSARAPTKPPTGTKRWRRPSRWSAKARAGAIDELMEQPMLASVLETGLAAFDLSCDGIGEIS